MSLSFHAIAIPLVARPVREVDRVYSVLTEDRGKLELLAKGSRKILSKLAGQMELPGVHEIFVVRGRTIDRLAGVSPQTVFPEIWQSFERKHALLAAGSFLDRSTRPGAVDRGLFSLFSEYLGALGRAPLPALQDGRLALAFQWKLFSRLGFRPDLSRCLVCHRAPSEPLFLSIRYGGVVCGSCAKTSVIECTPFASDLRTALAAFLDASFDDLAERFLAPSPSSALRALTRAWTATHLEMESMM